MRLVTMTLALSLFAPAAAAGPLYEYFDAHPIPGSSEDAPSWCLDEGRHGHEYALDPEQEPVVVVDEVRYYVGDSVAHGSPVEAVWYWGAHPMHHVGAAWCVLDGPHAHYWRPWWRAASYRSHYWAVHDGYWTYAGPYDDGYRWSYDRWYVRHHRIHSYRIASPRYSVRYRSTRHPAVVYQVERRPLPRWDYRTYRRQDDRYRDRSRYEDDRRREGSRDGDRDRSRDGRSRSSGGSKDRRR